MKVRKRCAMLMEGKTKAITGGTCLIFIVFESDVQQCVYYLVLGKSVTLAKILDTNVTFEWYLGTHNC